MELPNRKKIRLQNYDYSNENYYFVTICTYNKQHLFGEINCLNDFGLIVESDLLNIPHHFNGVRIDKYCIMPNHIHAIIIIGCEQKERSRPFPTLSTIVGLYKSGVSKQIHKINPSIKIWQKSFNDRIIRNENEYLEVWNYIDNNQI